MEHGEEINCWFQKSDQRCMAVVGFVPLCSRGDTYPSGHCVALTAMSEGSLKVIISDSARKSDDTFGNMLPVAELRYHVRPILSLATIAVPVDTQLNNSVILACSGATNGEIGIWNITELSEFVLRASTRGFGNNLDNLRVIKKPVTSIPLAHHSGVNSLALAHGPSGLPGRFIISSGGDDQSLRVTLLPWTGPSHHAAKKHFLFQ